MTRGSKHSRVDAEAWARRNAVGVPTVGSRAILRTEIAEAFGVSVERVRQIEERALGKLRGAPSSAALSDDVRPEFRRMLQDIFSPSSEVGSIIVTHGSRFMRNATKARVHKEALRKRGIRVVAIQQEVSDDPNGRFAEGVF